MKIKDYFTRGVTNLRVHENLKASNLVYLCKYGVVIDVLIIDSKYYCSISAYLDKSESSRYHIALFPVRSNLTTCQVVDLCIWLLHDMGYIKGLKKK